MCTHAHARTCTYTKPPVVPVWLPAATSVAPFAWLVTMITLARRWHTGYPRLICTAQHSEFRLTPGTHLAAIIYLPLLSPHITVTLPLYAMTSKICSIVPMRSFFFSNAMMREASKTFLCLSRWLEKFSFLFVFLPSCCLLSACVSNREHAHSQIHQSEELKRKRTKKSKQRKQSFLSELHQTLCHIQQTLTIVEAPKTEH